MNLKCYKVKCVEKDGTEHEIGVMCSDETAAKKCAENSLREGSHIETTAKEVWETDRI